MAQRVAPASTPPTSPALAPGHSPQPSRLTTFSPSARPVDPAQATASRSFESSGLPLRPAIAAPAVATDVGQDRLDRSVASAHATDAARIAAPCSAPRHARGREGGARGGGRPVLASKRPAEAGRLQKKLRPRSPAGGPNPRSTSAAPLTKDSNATGGRHDLLSSRAAVIPAAGRDASPQGAASPCGLTADPAHNPHRSAGVDAVHPADVPASVAVEATAPPHTGASA